MPIASGCYINWWDLFCILIVLLFNSAMCCIISTTVVVFEININLSIYRQCRQQPRARRRGCLRKMAAWYFQHMSASQSITDVLCIVSTELSIFCTKISISHNDMTVLYLATYRSGTYLPAADSQCRAADSRCSITIYRCTDCGVVSGDSWGSVGATIVRCLGPTPTLIRAWLETQKRCTLEVDLM